MVLSVLTYTPPLTDNYGEKKCLPYYTTTSHLVPYDRSQHMNMCTVTSFQDTVSDVVPY